MSEITTTTQDEQLFEVEEPTAEASRPATIGLEDLKPADRKHLERIFDCALPKRGNARLVTAKQKGGKCQCGCDSDTESEFAIGHDAKMKSMLKSVVAGETPKTPNYRGSTKASAQKYLAERGW